jgi:SlyX protein
MDHSNGDTAGRIDELEARLAQQDQSIIELGDEVYRQQQQIARLELQLLHLADRMLSIAAGDTPGDPADETPPHY